MTSPSKNFSALLFASLVLVSCTFIHHQQPSLPARASLTPGETVTVGKNQNVYAVARQHNVSMRDLIVLNDLKAPFTLKEGQQLTLPYGARSETPYNAPYSTASSSSPSLPPPPMNSGSARSMDVEAVPLPPIETSPPQPVHSPSNIRSGAVSSAPVTAAPVESLNAPATPPRPVATTAEPSRAEQIASERSPDAESHPSAITMKWPVQGPILSSFGPKGQGLNNDGINIGAPKGAPVVAAASGIVAYAGNEMKGFGNLVLIRHHGGWVTAYAHLDRALVTKDVVVAQGDMIGTVGKTGDAASPQLHFETRYNGKPVDPKGIIKE
ncbi:MAG: M23 family metallopeptidase [Alphaproteobacteria bacterium]|nr:M23 family metallopeptidase [Alphaproteobacteria bacterium]